MGNFSGDGVAKTKSLDNDTCNSCGRSITQAKTSVATGCIPKIFDYGSAASTFWLR